MSVKRGFGSLRLLPVTLFGVAAALVFKVQDVYDGASHYSAVGVGANLALAQQLPQNRNGAGLMPPAAPADRKSVV